MTTAAFEGETSLAQQVAVITGGATGIGLGTAHALARRGCRVVLASRNAERVAAAAASVPGAWGVPHCDVQDLSTIERLFAQVDARFGQLDILVTSAGIARSPKSPHHVPRPIAQLEPEVFDDILATNLRGVFWACRAAAVRMVPAGRGQIMNISSARAARRGLPLGAGYCASKRAALALLEAMAAELAPRGIRVTSFLPDVVETGMIAATALGKQGALTTQDVGEWIATLLAQPAETAIVDPGLLPLGSRAK